MQEMATRGNCDIENILYIVYIFGNLLEKKININKKNWIKIYPELDPLQDQ